MGSHSIPETLDSIFCSQRFSFEKSFVHSCISDKSVLQCWSSFSCFKHCKIQPVINQLLILELRRWPIKEWWNLRSYSISCCPLICWSCAICSNQILLISICVKHTWREHSRNWTRTHKTVMILSLLGTLLTTSQQDDHYKNSLDELPFSSQRTWVKSHKCKLSSCPWAKQAWKGMLYTGHACSMKRAMTVSHTQKRRKDVARHNQTLISSSWLPL